MSFALRTKRILIALSPAGTPSVEVAWLLLVCHQCHFPWYVKTQSWASVRTPPSRPPPGGGDGGGDGEALGGGDGGEGGGGGGRRGS